MPFNYVDLLLFLVILLSVWSGWRRGFIIGALELAGWLGSLVLAFMLYPYAGRLLGQYWPDLGMWTLPLAFIATLILVRVLISAILNLILRGIPGTTHTHIANKTLGVVPGILNGIIWAALLATLVTILPLWDGLSAKSRESRLAVRLTDGVSRLEDKVAPALDSVVRHPLGRMTVEPESDSFIKLPYKVSTPEVRPDLEAKMLELVNRERTQRSLRPLKADPEMAEVARAHSGDMFARGYFAHKTPEGRDPFDRMRSRKVRFITAGENLALARTLNMAHEGLMNSPGHRANILQPSFGRLGIGILDGGIYGLMVTQNFRN